jgi:hypothetical protein
MQDPNQQEPESGSSAGDRPLVPVVLSRTKGNSSATFVAAAAGIGLLVGVGIALTARHASHGAPPRVSEALSTHSSGMNTVPPIYAATAPSLLSQVDNQKKANVASPLLPPVSRKPTKKSAAANKKNGIHKLRNWKKGQGKQNGAKRRPYVSPNPPASSMGPTALELAAAAAAEEPFFVGIEGDVTVASYDVAMGTVGTYEGSNFVLDKAGSENGAIPWDDYPFNVHYRCDGSGNCTLVHRGATASAKMTR